MRSQEEIKERQEAIGVLVAGRMVLERLRVSFGRSAYSLEEREALLSLEEIIKRYGYRPSLLEAARISSIHVAFLKGRLAFYTQLEKRGTLEYFLSYRNLSRTQAEDFVD